MSKKAKYILIIILFLGLWIRLFRLDNLPGEMWGDVAELYEFITYILAGKWPWYYVLGNGPLFSYLAVPIALLFGLSFFSLKLTGVLIGTSIILVSFLIAKEIFNTKTALITGLLVSVSRWPLTFSRLGTMNILVPLFVGLSIYFLIRIMKNNNIKNWIWLAIVMGVGLYNYPAFSMIVPPSAFIILLIFLVLKGNHAHNWKNSLVSLFIFSLFTIPFVHMVTDKSGNWFSPSSYFAGKIVTNNGSLMDKWWMRLGGNIKSSLLMFNIKGDSTFRVNIPGEPHLDFFSGVFLIVGLLILLFKKQRFKWIIIYFFFVLQIPQILVLNFPNEVPSATRSVGLFPMLYPIIAYGLCWILIVCKKLRIPIITTSLLIAIVGLIITRQNMEKYFFVYANGLPNHNVPYAKIIAKEIDKLPSNVTAYLTSCCWADWGQPDSKPIAFSLSDRQRKIEYTTHISQCNEVLFKPAVILFSPRDLDLARKFKQCFPEGEFIQYRVDSQDIFNYLLIK